MRRVSYLLTLIISLFLISNGIAGDEEKSEEYFRIPPPDTIQVLTVQDGSSLIGRIVEVGENEIIFRTDLGEMTIAKSKIRKIEEVPAETMRGGARWFENPNSTRLYFAPTARMLKKGDGYFSDYMLFFPGVAYGITGNFTFGGGMSLIPGVDIDDQVFYFTPKIGIEASRKTSFAVGALVLALPEIDDESPLVGVLYGVGTFGEPDGSVTAGIGYGFVDDEIADKPLVMLGGEKRFSRRMSFVSENWIFPGVDDPLVSYGFRFFGEDISVDLALFNMLGEDAIFPGVPWVDFVFNF
jgi:hypothetical protein